MENGLSTNFKRGWTDVWVSHDEHFALSRMELNSSRRAPAFVRHLVQAASRSLRAGGLIANDDILWFGRWLGPEGLSARRSKIVLFGTESREAEHLYEVGTDGHPISNCSYPTGARLDDPEALMPSPPAIGMIWVAAKHRGQGWGRMFAQVVMEHYDVGALAWGMPLSAGGLALAKATSPDGRVWGWR